MNVTTLALHNFRNFTQVDEITLPADSLLVAAAPNATGKTNFLEALVVLLRGKSWRASHAECVQWGKESFTVRGTITHDTREAAAHLAVQYYQPQRRLRVEEDGVPASPVTFYSHYPLILFLPEDTFIFSRGPVARRNFLNRILVSRPQYVAALVQYQRVLKQRNMALKSAGSFEDIAVWTDVLVEHADELWRHRLDFVTYTKNHVNEIYEHVSGESASFDLVLERDEKEEPLRDTLQRLFPQEKRYGYTLAGPHRDDMVLRHNDRSVSATLSRGQLRSLAVALKVASFRYIHALAHEKPIVLLDDVLSELDAGRQEALLHHLPAAQVIVTCTSVPPTIYSQKNVHALDLSSILSAEAPLPEVSPAAVPAAA